MRLIAGDTALCLIVLFFLAGTRANWVSYTLSYATTDCSGPAYKFFAVNKTTCTAGSCVSSSVTSQRAFCYAGSLASLANPIECPGCAYCGWVNYPTGINCGDSNNWISAQFDRIGTCVPDPPLWSKYYGCTASGGVGNITTYNDAACTIVRSTGFAAWPPCDASSPQCTCPATPSCSVSTATETGYCSYAGISWGGGGGGNTTKPGNATVLHAHLAVVALAVALLSWACL